MPQLPLASFLDFYFLSFPPSYGLSSLSVSFLHVALEITSKNAAMKDTEDKGICPWRVEGKQASSCEQGA